MVFLGPNRPIFSFPFPSFALLCYKLLLVLGDAHPQSDFHFDYQLRKEAMNFRDLEAREFGGLSHVTARNTTQTMTSTPVQAKTKMKETGNTYGKGDDSSSSRGLSSAVDILDPGRASGSFV